MFFSRLLLANVCSAVLLGVILLLKKLLGQRVSQKFHYQLWYLLLVSLTIPFLPKDLFQLSLAQKAMTPAGFGGEYSLIAPAISGDWQYDVVQLTGDWETTLPGAGLMALWLTGVMIVFMWYFLGNKKIQLLKRTMEPVPAELLLLFADGAVRERICLGQSDLLLSPVSFGCRQPYIVFPREIIEKATPKELEHMLLHELMHIRHKDLWLNFWLCALQMLYWFQPLVWWAFSRMRQEREVYCDWAVLHCYHSVEERLEYGRTLLRFAGAQGNRSVHTANSLFGDKKQIKRRIVCIANYKKETAWGTLLRRGVILLLLCSIGLEVPAYGAVAWDSDLYYRSERPIAVQEHDYSAFYGASDGSAVIYDEAEDVYHVYHEQQVHQRIAPCSTYKIYSALNGLEQGVIKASDTVLQWDGISRELAAWNETQDLHSAMQNSVNWYFQALDTAVGAEELEGFYRKIGYGNGSVGKDAAAYWKDGRLKISPLEQVMLLTKFYHNDWQMKQENLQAVKDALFLTERNGCRLYGKTGTGRTDGSDVSGWFVGYVETAENVYFFAIHLQDEAHADGAAAVETAAGIFASMGIQLNC